MMVGPQSLHEAELSFWWAVVACLRALNPGALGQESELYLL